MPLHLFFLQVRVTLIALDRLALTGEEVRVGKRPAAKCVSSIMATESAIVYDALIASVEICITQRLAAVFKRTAHAELI